MKKHPVNWHLYQSFFPLEDPKKSQKRKLPYYFFALAMAAGGTWLLLVVLGFQGYHPFRTQPSFSADNLLVEAFSPSVSHWSDEIQGWADAWNLDPLLIATVMQIESCGNPDALSPAGAQGLFQVMPYHFEPGEDPFDPATNAKRGLAYLQQSYQLSDGNIELALAGYNGGHGQIPRKKSLWPDETQRYVQWGSAIYQEATLGKEGETALSAWLTAGGWRLCKTAEEILKLN